MRPSIDLTVVRYSGALLKSEACAATSMMGREITVSTGLSTLVAYR